MQRAVHDVGAIAGMLNDRIEALAPELLPAGVRSGAEWRVGSIAGEAGLSMAVHLGGAKAGVWCDYGGPRDHRGDALDLVAQVLFRGDKRQALRWARAWLGLDAVDPASIAVRRRDAVAKKAKARSDDERRRGLAMHMFIEAEPKLFGTRSHDYLRDRGIDFATLGRQPRALRHHKGLVHPETGEVAPALVAAICAVDGTTVAVHRTFLEPAGDVRKLRGVADAKLTLGSYAGGCIRLWRGSSGKAFKDAPAGEWLVVGEGIEDTLTAVMARPDLRAVCAVSLANMGSLLLPSAIEGVIILAQNGDGPAAQRALERAIENFQGQGKRVRLARPDPGVKDVNDLVRRNASSPAG